MFSVYNKTPKQSAGYLKPFVAGIIMQNVVTLKNHLYAPF